MTARGITHLGEIGAVWGAAAVGIGPQPSVFRSCAQNPTHVTD
jgi:hypothetical protein